MGQSGPLELGVAQIAKPHRLQAGPPEPKTRGGRFDRDERVILKGSEQWSRSRRFLLHFCSLVARSIGPLSRRITGPGIIRSTVEVPCHAPVITATLRSLLITRLLMKNPVRPNRPGAARRFAVPRPPTRGRCLLLHGDCAE